MRTYIALLLSILPLFSTHLYKNDLYVVDKTNNLLWQDTRDNAFMLGSQVEANEYCQSLILGGYSSWRLPTKDEYSYIIDKNRRDEIMINKSFRYVIQEGYWTSSRTWRSFGRYGYYFFVKSGNLYYENRNYPKFFRCVMESN
jgi:hypothetical protein